MRIGFTLFPTRFGGMFIYCRVIVSNHSPIKHLLGQPSSLDVRISTYVLSMFMIVFRR